MLHEGFELRLATLVDLPALNQVIEAAVMSWQLPERVKRLSLASYRYDETDLQHLEIWVAEDSALGIVGVAGWEAADPLDLPKDWQGVLLHGLYVMPEQHGRGWGRRLLALAESTVAQGGYDGVLVKAQAEAVGFFERQGYEYLPVEDGARHYAQRMWKRVSPS